MIPITFDASGPGLVGENVSDLGMGKFACIYPTPGIRPW
jgi:hypothetical protein